MATKIDGNPRLGGRVGKALTNLLVGVGSRRTLDGLFRGVVHVYAAAVAVWVLYAAVWAIIDPWELGAVFLMAMMALIFLTIAPFPKSPDGPPPLLDWVLAGLSVAAGVYFFRHAGDVVQRISLLDPLTAWDVFFGTATLVLTVEATRRSVGMGLTLVVGAFVAYIFLGHLLTGVMSHGTIEFPDFLDQMVFTTNGVFGLPIRVAATYAFLFVLFGTALHQAGGGDFYDKIATVAAGRRAGGPAKVAVLSSAFFGMLSGSPTSDVVTTGSFTIPMMKRMGYSPVFAAAVETAASTGGSILPPVMGSAAFMMAEFTGIPYVRIAVAALIPALLYYYCVYMQVHYRSLRRGLVGLPKEKIPRFAETMRTGGLFAIPLGVMVVALLRGYTPSFVAVLASASVVAVALIRPETRIGPVQLGRVLAQATMRMVPVTAACAAAGLVVGAITMSGLGGKFSRLVFTLTGHNMFFSLVMIAGLCILLGMGMPTPSAYILAAVLAGPLLGELGVPLLPAHLFLVYYAVLSAITPPVAVAAYAASSIADANPFQIATSAVRLAIIVFVVPFVFVYDQALLLQDGVFRGVLAALTAGLGTTALAVGVEGWFRTSVSWWRRLLALAGGGLLLFPGLLTDAAGLALAAAALSSQCWRGARAAGKADIPGEAHARAPRSGAPEDG